MPRFDQPVPARPPTDDFGEPETSWWDLPIAGGEDIESIDPGLSGEVGPGYATSPRPAPRQTAEAPPFMAEFQAYRPSPGGGRAGWMSPVAGLEQAIKVKELRERLRGERREPPAIKPGRLEPLDVTQRRELRKQKKQRTLADLKYQIAEMELQKRIQFADLESQLKEARLQRQIREAKRPKEKPQKRRRPRPVWGI